MKNTIETSAIRLVKRRRRRVNPYIIRRFIITAVVLAMLAPIAVLFSLGVISARSAQRATSYIPEKWSTNTRKRQESPNTRPQRHRRSRLRSSF